MAERIIAHLGTLIDEGPRLDGLNCVHTEPPTVVYPLSRENIVKVMVYREGNPHETPQIAASETYELFLRDQDKGTFRQPISEESVIWYATRALNSSNSSTASKGKG